MAVSVTCPGCRTSYPVTEDLLGKKIRCKKCQETFTAAAAKSAVASRATDERITTSKPAGARGGNGRYDDDEGESPRRNGNGRGRPMAKKPAAKSGNKGLLIGAVVGGLLLVGGGVAVGVLMFNKDDSNANGNAQANASGASSSNSNTLPVSAGPAATSNNSSTAAPEKVEADKATMRTTAPDASAPQPLTIVKPMPRPADFRPDVVERVKKSAVMIRVTEEEGTGYGSGWFAEKHGDEVFIVTNSHVVGMKEAAKPPPDRIEVILNSGTPQERIVEGKLLAVDREEDLAVIRIKDKDLPDPLPIAPSFDIQESQKLLILGFPHGKFLEDELRRGLGVRVTTTLKARQTTVAGRMFNDDGSVRYIQVEGGADPGNSGGAAVDTNGHVTAILVAGDPGSNMRWVIPSEYAIHLLLGRVLKVVPGQSIMSGGQVQQPITALVADPLKRIRKVEADVFVGKKPNPAKGDAVVRPAPEGAPQPQEGDGPRATMLLSIDPNEKIKLGEPYTAHGEVMLPPLKDSEIYWFQPHYDLKDGKQRWGEAVAMEMGRYPVEAKPAHLERVFKRDNSDGRQVDIDSRIASGSDAGANDLKLAARMTERVADQLPNGDTRVRYQYKDLRLGKKEQDDQIRHQMRGVMEQAKNMANEVTYTKDGQLTKPKAVMVNVADQAKPLLRRFNDQIVRSLESVTPTLPNKDCQPGDTWTEETHISLTVGQTTQNALYRVECKYVGCRVRDGREEAVIEMTGRISKNGSGSLGGGGIGRPGARGAAPGGGGNSGADSGDDDNTPYDEDGNLKKGFYGVLHAAAVVDVETGQVVFGRTESDTAVVFPATFHDPRSNQDVTVNVHAGSYLDVTLRRSLTKDPPKPGDPLSLLPNQPRIYRPLVGAASSAVAAADVSPSPIVEKQSTFMKPDMAEKVKKATVLIRVQEADGGAEGSGWFAEPGIIVTNCHVVGMLSKTDRPPEKIEVFLDMGLPTERNLPGKLLAVDREDDLAIIKVEGENLPQPLTTHAAEPLYETQALNVVGFPKGQGLATALERGLNVRDLRTTLKLRPTNVAGRVFKADNSVKYIQLEGGADHGNSGGPVVDEKGDVRCVLVAGLDGTTLRFAIPSEYAAQVIQGYPLEVLPGRAYLDGSTGKQQVTVKYSDPLGRVTKVTLEYWVGNPGNPRKPTRKAPTPGPGDGERKSVVLHYDPSSQAATGEFELPEVAPGRTLWLQPRFTNGTGQEQWSRAIAYAPDGPPVERKAAVLANHYRRGTQRAIELTTLTNLHYVLFGNETNIGIPFHVSMNENVLATGSKGMAARINLEYKDLELDIKKLMPALADAPPEIAARIERIVQQRFKPLLNLIKGLIVVVDVTRDGHMKNPRIDVRRLPPAVQPIMLQFNDQVYSSLQALTFPLPGKEVPYGHTWDFPTDLFISPTGKARNEGAAFKMHFKYVGVRERGGRQEAVVEITGSLADNPNAKGVETDMKTEPPQTDKPDDEPAGPNAARPHVARFAADGEGPKKVKKGLYGVAHGYAYVDTKDGFVAEVKLFLDLDVEIMVRNPQSKMDVPVVAGGNMELLLMRRTSR
jgi:predicted Zn finger-like uncharacterized protein